MQIKDFFFFFVKQSFSKPYQICSKQIVASNKIKFCQTLLQNKTLFAMMTNTKKYWKKKVNYPKIFQKTKLYFEKQKMITTLKFCDVYCMSITVLAKHKDILRLGLRDFINNFNN